MVQQPTINPEDITEIHVLPVDDLVEHVSEADCICGPECCPIERFDGSVAYSYIHHSLDGREEFE